MRFAEDERYFIPAIFTAQHLAFNRAKKPMTKFLRKIRQKLLSENNMSKYLVYGIGEIVLVVIGILIALSINNWNDGRKDNLKEQAILVQLEKEYNANLVQLEDKMQMSSSVIASGLSLLK
jgi:hypothetical protein